MNDPQEEARRAAHKRRVVWMIRGYALLLAVGVVAMILTNNSAGFWAALTGLTSVLPYVVEVV